VKPTLRWFTEAWTVSVVELRDGSPNRRHAICLKAWRFKGDALQNQSCKIQAVTSKALKSE